MAPHHKNILMTAVLPRHGAALQIHPDERGAVEKVLFYPQTPQGGLAKLLYFNKSPLGDLGVATKREDFFNNPLITTSLMMPILF
jgi:hypothetical protein